MPTKEKTTRQKPGPKFKITVEDRNKILGAVGVGGSLNDAAKKIGVNISTLRRLRIADPEFAKAIETEEATGKLILIERVTGSSAWQAAAWMLERKYGREYGRRERLEHSGKDGGPIKTEHETKHTVDYDAIEKELGAIARRMAPGVATDDRG